MKISGKTKKNFPTRRFRNQHRHVYLRAWKQRRASKNLAESCKSKAKRRCHVQPAYASEMESEKISRVVEIAALQWRSVAARWPVHARSGAICLRHLWSGCKAVGLQLSARMHAARTIVVRPRSLVCAGPHTPAPYPHRKKGWTYERCKRISNTSLRGNDK